MAFSILPLSIFAANARLARDACTVFSESTAAGRSCWSRPRSSGRCDKLLAGMAPRDIAFLYRPRKRLLCTGRQRARGRTQWSPRGHAAESTNCQGSVPSSHELTCRTREIFEQTFIASLAPPSPATPQTFTSGSVSVSAVMSSGGKAPSRRPAREPSQERCLGLGVTAIAGLPINPGKQSQEREREEYDMLNRRVLLSVVASVGESPLWP